jgi:hypothetical protein
MNTHETEIRKRLPSSSAEAKKRITPAMLESAQAYLSARLHFRNVRNVVEGYQRAILSTGSFLRAETGEPVLIPAQGLAALILVRCRQSQLNEVSPSPIGLNF